MKGLALGLLLLSTIAVAYEDFGDSKTRLPNTPIVGAGLATSDSKAISAAQGVVASTLIQRDSSGITDFSLAISSSARGAAGIAATAVCNNTTATAVFGGCDCNTIVGATSIISIPNVVTPGSDANGWTCQVVGGTGGQCAAYVLCGLVK